MQAMLFAAGLGSRLRPITNTIPKALVEIHGKTALERAILHLKKHGVKRMVVNIHYFADQVIAFLEKQDFEVEICISNEQAQLLETGGGLKHAQHFFEPQKPIFIYNADILSNINLTALHQKHQQSGGLATLAVRNRISSRQLSFDTQQNILTGWRNNKTNETKTSRTSKANKWLAFSGIQIVEYSIFDWLPPATQPYSTIPIYLEMAKTENLFAYQHDQDFWWDIGTPEKLEATRQFFKKLEVV